MALGLINSQMRVIRWDAFCAACCSSRLWSVLISLSDRLSTHTSLSPVFKSRLLSNINIDISSENFLEEIIPSLSDDGAEIRDTARI